MVKRSARQVRKVRETLHTPATRPAGERALAVQSEGAVLKPSVGIRPPLPTSFSVPNPYGGATQPDATGQIGAAGNLNVFGFLTGEDYNPDLDGFAMFPNYNKMRLSDAQVNATLLMLKLPLKGARWIVRPASEDPQDVAIATFVQANLIDDDGLARSWQHVLDNAMLKFDFGCGAEEIIWGLGESGEARVLDLAPRLPRTFYRWIEDPKTGQLAALQQFAPKNGQYGYWNIPAQNLTLHVRAREGNAYYGRSVLRSAYPHWWWKQQLYRIDMIGHDRFHVGIPRAALDANYNVNTAPLDKLEATLKGLRSHDRAYMVQPFGVTYDVYGVHSAGTGTSGILQSIEHHNLMIARNILQSFAAQGEQRHGSFGAAKVTSDVYFDALAGEANEIGSELKQAVVKRLCDLNFNMVGRPYPTIVCTDISAVDFNQLAESIAALADKGILTPDDDLEAWIRDLIDAPGLPDALKNQPRTRATAPAFSTGGNPASPAEPTQIEASRRTPFVERGRSFSRRPTWRERTILDLHGIPSTLDTMRDRLVHALAGIRRSQLVAVAKRIAQKDGRDTAAFTDIRHAHIAMPQIADLEKAIREAQTHAFDFGRTSVQGELKKQGVKPRHELADNPTSAKNLRTAQSTLVSSAKITARKQAETWKARIMDEGLRIRRTGVTGADLESRIVDNLDDEIESGAKRDAAAEIHEGFGLGRAYAASDLSGSIETAQYSAILDANTCEPCQDLDGEEFEVDSAEYFDALPPYKDCDGRDQCRCVMILIAKEEAA